MKITLDDKKKILTLAFNTPEGNAILRRTLYEFVSEILFTKLIGILDSGAPNAVEMVVGQMMDSLSLNEPKEVRELRMMNIGGVQ